MPTHKQIALVAHDNKKAELIEWLKANQKILANHSFHATGTTGAMIEKTLGFNIHKYESGPLGGDVQISALIVEGKIDLLIFFWDPLEAQPHDPDIRALLRIAVVWNIPVACNVASADFIIHSPYLSDNYQRKIPNYALYRKRSLQQ